MTPAWTGGQYSVFRALFGATLFVYFIHWISFDTMALPDAGLCVAGAAASIALLIGMRDRIAALMICSIGAWLFLRNPMTPDPGVFFVGWLLLAHTFLPARPFGSWDARGRLDPDSGWRMPSTLYTTAWIVMAVGTLHAGASGSRVSGATEFARPSSIDGSIGASESIFAPLTLLARIRPWLWLAMLGMHIGLVSLTNLAVPVAGMSFLLFFTFDPGWITPRLPERQAGHTLVFYDGACGLCHRTIRFLLAEDAAGLRFRFAPLDSDRFRSAYAAAGSGFDLGDSIPDSVLVQRPGEAMLTRAEGVLEIGHQLGGLWRLLVMVAGWLPLSALNAGYDFIARVRHRLFAQPSDACPLLPPHLRDRFHP